jgi:hypothetical protein
MNLDKYKIPMGELPSSVKNSIQKEIQHSDFLDFQHAYEIHKEKTFSTGICRNSKGAVFVTCVTDIPKVTPKMIDWWFGWHMPETERYKLWHPRDHISSKLTVDTSDFKTDKEKYIHVDSYVKEYIGKELKDLCISFVEPTEFGFSELDSDKETAVCAHVKDLSRNVSIGSLTHLVIRNPKGSLMQSSFWLGMNPEHGIPFLNIIIKPLLKIKKIKTFLLPDTLALNLLIHCAEEMNHLAKFLPELYGDTHQ